MKRFLVFILTAAVTFIVFSPGAWSQESATDEFMLEEITVTAEKREVVVQKLPSSVVAIDGANLVSQGKITTQQILEGVPNVTLTGGGANAGVNAGSPNTGIAIRGIKYKQTSDGQPAAATATYVDGIFQGIGGNYDIERVEVLRGPQGTLYGRSATGGVVSFHTVDPKLSEFGVSASAEIGEANLMNFQAALNAPYGDEFAIRAAWHHSERDGYHNEDGGWSRTSEGRVKALWMPTESFDIMLTAALSEGQSNSGGYSARLTDPDTIDYESTVTDIVKGAAMRNTMYALTANNDFGDSILTYIFSYRHFKDTDSPPGVSVREGVQIMHNQFLNYGENFYTHELRLASDTDSWWTWLIGMNYYNSDYDRYQVSVNHRAFIPSMGGIPDPDPATNDAPLFEQPTNGEITNFGIFTEETFNVTDVFRVTAGLRYDQTEVNAFSAFNLNANENEYRNAMNPPDYVFFGMEDTIDFDNVTYKLRLEYDLTPDNLLYAVTATGFQPGDLRLTNKMEFGPNGPEFVFFALPYDEEKLTTYEVGSKNRFFDNTLQVNLNAFFYDYEGYRHTVNTAQFGPPVFAVLPVPMEMKGAEFDIAWMLTANDMINFAAGYVDAKITEYPDIPELNPTSQYIAMKRVPGIPEMTAKLDYNHTFNLPDGSILVPRIEFRYTKGMHIDNLTANQVVHNPPATYDLRPYAYQDDYYLTDVGATWTSANNMFAVSGYVRNVFDEEYKTGVQLGGSYDAVGVTPGDPRTWGIVISAKY
jgi:iron complex outermembrane receptor protein